MTELYATLATIIAGVIAALVNKWLNGKFKPSQLNALSVFASDVVQAAEEAGRAFGYDGAQKLDYATNALIALASKVGVKLDTATAEALIHSSLKGFREYEDTTNASLQQLSEKAYSEGLDAGIASVLDRLENEAAQLKETTEAISTSK